MGYYIFHTHEQFIVKNHIVKNEDIHHEESSDFTLCGLKRINLARRDSMLSPYSCNGDFITREWFKANLTYPELSNTCKRCTKILDKLLKT